MALFLFRFWPVLAPFACYSIWLLVQRERARRAGMARPHFRDGPIYWLVIASLGIAALCFVFSWTQIESHKGDYVPPHMENGKLMPAKVIEK